MRTALECRAMATRMEVLAAGDAPSHIRSEWRAMAVAWRQVAREAEWQDCYAFAMASA